jgi:hypothetical protein
VTSIASMAHYVIIYDSEGGYAPQHDAYYVRVRVDCDARPLGAWPGWIDGRTLSSQPPSTPLELRQFWRAAVSVLAWSIKDAGEHGELPQAWNQTAQEIPLLAASVSMLASSAPRDSDWEAGESVLEFDA